MDNLNEMTVEELVAVRDEANGLIKSKRAEARESAKADANAREVNARANVKEGSIVSFLFNKVATEGKVVRASEKTVTVASEAFKNGKNRYRKYSDILEVAEAEADSEAEATE